MPVTRDAQPDERGRARRCGARGGCGVIFATFHQLMTMSILPSGGPHFEDGRLPTAAWRETGLGAGLVHRDKLECAG